MKRIVLFYILILLSNYSYGQVLVANGTVLSNGDYENTGENYLTEHCSWFELVDSDMLICKFFPENSNQVSKRLGYEIHKKVQEKGTVSYHVTTESGEVFLLSFTKDPELVFILNVNTNDFSTMSGRGVDFSNIIK